MLIKSQLYNDKKIIGIYGVHVLNFSQKNMKENTVFELNHHLHSFYNLQSFLQIKSDRKTNLANKLREL